MAANPRPDAQKPDVKKADEAPKKKKRKLSLDIDEVDVSEVLERKISAC